MNVIRIREVTKKIGLCKTTIYRRIAAGEFPRPIDLGGVVGWLESDIDAWIQKRIDLSQKVDKEGRLSGAAVD